MSRRLAIPSPGWLDRAPTWVHRTAVGAGLVGALALGVAGPSQAFADPGGAPNANASATAQGSAGSNASNAGATGSPGNSAAAPGQVKQDPGPTVSSQGGILVSSLTTSSTSGNTKDYPNPGATKDNPVLPNYTGSTTTGSTGDVKSGSATSHDTGNFGTDNGTTGVIHQPQPLSTADQNSGGANGQCSGTNNGPYCSTRDGAPSLNGNGNGNAYGKPCAGCVGRADNKNPQGQNPGGNDHNAGYECDSNKGIGKTNPAHTGCKTTTPPQCQAGQTGTPPNCVTPQCQAGQTGTPPNCVTPQCQAGQTGTPPNCVTPQCQAGQSGTPPNCITNNPQCVPTTDNPCTTPTGCVATAANNFCGNPPTGCKPTPANNFCSEVLGEVNQKPTVVDGVSLPTTNKPGVQVLGEKVTRGGTLPFTGTDALGLATTSALFLLGGTVLLWLGRRRRTA